MIRWPKPYLPPINLWNVPRLENDMTAPKERIDSEEKRAFSLQEFSARWGWGLNTTYNLINSGKLKSVKIGRRRVITVKQENEFAALIEAESDQSRR